MGDKKVYGKDYYLGCRGLDHYLWIGDFPKSDFKDMLSGMVETRTTIDELINECDYATDPEKARNSVLVKINMPIEFTVREKYGTGAMLEWIGFGRRDLDGGQNKVVHLYTKNQ
jgi:hypothetical protein